MNNRYIFRGKRKSDGEWIYGALDSEWALPPEERERYWISPAYLDDSFVIPETIGQCTGLEDKNGKWIYEGDLLRFTNSDNEQSIYKVFYDDVYAGYRIQEIDLGGLDEMSNWENNREYFEVIGNIHDTPNLLKLEHDSLCETETYKAGDTE